MNRRNFIATALAAVASTYLKSRIALARIRGGNATSQGGSSSDADADFAARASGPGVVWAHSFAAQSEVTQWMVSGANTPYGTFTGGNDPTGQGINPASYLAAGSVGISPKTGAVRTQAGGFGGTLPATVWTTDGGSSSSSILNFPSGTTCVPTGSTYNLNGATAQNYLYTFPGGKTWTAIYIVGGGDPTPTASQFTLQGPYAGYLGWESSGGSWLRPFFPVASPDNGLSTNDPAANGSIALSPWNANNQGTFSSYQQGTGFYGNADYHTDSTWQGVDFYVCFRMRYNSTRFTPIADPSGGMADRVSGGLWYPPGGKSAFIDEIGGSYQEIILISGGDSQAHYYYPQTFPAQMYTQQGVWDLQQPLPGIGGTEYIQAGSQYLECTFGNSAVNQAGVCWTWDTASWDNVMIHVGPGHQSNGASPVSARTSQDTTVEMFVQRPSERTWTLVFRGTNLPFFFGGNNAPNKFGWQMLALNCYFNDQPWATPLQQDYTQIIFSQLYIPPAAPVGTSAPTWFNALAHKQWVAPLSNWIGSVLDPNATNPPYYGTTGPSAIFSTWTGMGADATRNTVWLAGNGGHADYANNAVYSCDLTQNSPAWVRNRNASGTQDPNATSAITSVSWAGGVVTVTTSSPLLAVSTGNLQIGGSFTTTIAGFTPSGYNGTYPVTITGASSFTYALASNPGTATVAGTYTGNDIPWAEWPDATPPCDHTGCMQVGAEGRWIKAGLGSPNWVGSPRGDAWWEFDPATNSWTYWGANYLADTYAITASAVYDPFDRQIIKIHSSSGQSFEFVNLDTKAVVTYTTANYFNSASLSYGAIDIVNRLLIVQCDDIPNTIYVLDLRNKAAGAYAVSCTGTPPLSNGFGHAFWYHIPSQGFISWDPSVGLKKLTLTLTGTQNNAHGFTVSAAAWTTVAGQSGTIPTIGSPLSGPLYNKVQFIPNMGNGDAAIVLYAQYGSPDLYVMRLHGGI